MLHVCSVFDRSSLPLITIVYDDQTKVHTTHKLYAPGTGKSIYEIEQECANIKQMFEDSKSPIACHDFLSHIHAFKIRIYNCPIYDRIDLVNTITSPADAVRYIKASINNPVAIWEKVKADVAIVYFYLYEKGVEYNYKIVRPNWRIDTYSGRSRVTEVSVQGANEEDILYNVNGDTIYVNFDWIAADMRMVAIMSSDAELLDTFNQSDPYSYLANKVGLDDMRNNAKLAMLRAVYSLDVSNPIFGLYDGLGQWVSDMRTKLDNDKFLGSILGRKFTHSANRTDESIVNAIIQGSVAHAMHITLRRIWDLYCDNILCENHDSIVLTARNTDEVRQMIKDVVPIMVRPFRGILDSDPLMPIEVSIGKHYKRWQPWRKYGQHQQQKAPQTANTIAEEGQQSQETLSQATSE